MDDGRVSHCELAVAGARWMMSDESIPPGSRHPTRPRRQREHAPHRRRLRRGRGARVEHGVILDRVRDSPPAGRVAVFRDPFGHRWFLNQRLGVTSDRRRRGQASQAPDIAIETESLVPPSVTVTVDWPASA